MRRHQEGCDRAALEFRQTPKLVMRGFTKERALAEFKNIGEFKDYSQFCAATGVLGLNRRSSCRTISAQR